MEYESAQLSFWALHNSPRCHMPGSVLAQMTSPREAGSHPLHLPRFRGI